ncbi:MAG: TaqI-like C-terminal specificity domain-containing protein [Candidatus Wallbacteria bacterium]|nr:TaqI-like C-terminal specificity domain-containing protein [Candidatus Wallbacteria bacterium]
MEKSQARKIVRETFESPFDKTRFTFFIKNLLNKIEDAPFTYQGNYIHAPFRPFISTLERIGKYSIDEHIIDILIVRLKKETSIERARTMQRNFVAGYLNGSRGDTQKDAALVAFVSPDCEDWRFSLVKMDYRLVQGVNGKVKAKEEFTPARRWSFLVGENENSHTAQSRLVPILEDDETKPTLAKLEEAFNIEKISNEFFDKYRGLFITVKEQMDTVLENDAKIRDDFNSNGLNTVDFSKKLLGQIVFLYFLQKKGWFGVARDAEWGTGPKGFLRDLLENKKKYCIYTNFFNDILEPLFYEALAIERPDDFYSKFNCKIPFLNGGLFEPIYNYDWVHTDILLPNEIISNNKKTKEGDIGDGILDVFDRYNFTVKEDEPLEKEVAIDPEMLGKAYEKFNAIRSDNFDEYKAALKSGNRGAESKFNKQYGVYYTPRDIVHYMCQQSLINYLVTELESKATKDEIEILVTIGDKVRENEERVESKGKESEKYSYKLSENIRKNSLFIDQKLAEIAVCDPAVGSGAFPVGMMTEIVKARYVLSIFIKEQERSIYRFKRECIENSLYGVDIDPGAVEIAKLRLWLSLIVEEEDFKHIKPLPNLDYKIMQGNSLLEEFEGIKLLDESIFSTISCKGDDKLDKLFLQRDKLQDELVDLNRRITYLTPRISELKSDLKELDKSIKKILEKEKKSLDIDNLFESQNIIREKTIELNALHRTFFKAIRKKEKDELRKQIDKLEWELIEASLQEQGKITELKNLEKIKKANIKPFFLWKLHFSEVFLDKKGFDIVVANPPFIFSRDSAKKGFTQKDKDFFYKNYRLSEYQLNYYPLFLEKGTDLLRQNGCISFITPNNWMTINSNKSMREFVLENSEITIVNFYAHVFDSAAVDNSIIIYKKSSENHKIRLFEFTDQLHFIKETECKFFLDQRDHVINIQMVRGDKTIAIIQKIETNSAKLGEIADVKAGLKAYETGTGNPPQTDEMKKTRIYHSNKRIDDSYLKYLDGCDVCRYCYVWSGEYLKYGENLAAPRKNFNLFSTRRILVRQIPSKPPYCINACLIDEIVLNDLNSMNVISIQQEPEYVLGILNSRLISWWFVNKLGKMQRETFPQFKVNELKEFPIPKDIDQKICKKITVLVSQILSAMHQSSDFDSSKLESEIDHLVYSIYDLSLDEIKIVEGNVK